MARHLTARAKGLNGWHNAPAQIDRLRAAGVKPATRGRIDGTWNVAVQRYIRPAPADRGIGWGYRAQECPG